MAAIFRHSTPLVPAGPSLTDALSFYVERLGFVIAWQDGKMAGVQRDGVTFNLIVSTNREWADNASFSIGVVDLEALYQEYRSVPAEVGPLEMKPWGRREFHLIVSPGVCFQFYEDV